MADGFNRTLHAVGSPNQGMALIAGHWAIGATGAVGAKTKAVGLTLARTDVGTYTLQVTNASADASVPVIAFLHAELIPASGDVVPGDDTDAIRTRVVTSVNTTGLTTIACVDEGDVVREAASGARLMVFAVLISSGDP